MEPRSDASPKPLSRVELLEQARELHIADADVMTRAELHAALERVRRPEPRVVQQPATWLGVARRLLASIVEQGLHLPDAAAVIRGATPVRSVPSGPPPVATVTLARIYATQGHLKRAIATLDEVLASDPDHDLARELRAQLATRWAEIQRDEALAGAAKASGPKSAGGKVPSPPAGAVATPVPVPASVRTHGEEEAPLSDTAISRGAPPPRLGDEPASAPSAATFSEAPLSEAPFSEGPPSESRAPDTTTPELESALFESVVPPAPPPEAEHNVFEVDTKVDHPSLPRRPAIVAEPLAPPSQLPPPPSFPEPSLPEPIRAEAAPLPEPEPLLPRPAGLVVIQIGAPETYLYWELERTGDAHNALNGSATHGAANGSSVLVPALSTEATSSSPAATSSAISNGSTSSSPISNGSTSSSPATSSGDLGEPHWISVVTHTARATGSERRERRFPVFRASGAVRLDGVPTDAVVRAKLARGEAPEASPLVVAGLVWAEELEALARAEARFTPPAAADPRALAQRAGEHLAKAAPVYW